MTLKTKGSRSRRSVTSPRETEVRTSCPTHPGGTPKTSSLPFYWEGVVIFFFSLDSLDPPYRGRMLFVSSGVVVILRCVPLVRVRRCVGNDDVQNQKTPTAVFNGT